MIFGQKYEDLNQCKLTITSQNSKSPTPYVKNYVVPNTVTLIIHNQGVPVYKGQYHHTNIATALIQPSANTQVEILTLAEPSFEGAVYHTEIHSGQLIQTNVDKLIIIPEPNIRIKFE